MSNTVQLFKAGDRVVVETFEKPLLIEGVVKRDKEVIYIMENKIIGEIKNSGILIDKTLEYNGAIGIIKSNKNDKVFMISSDKGWSYTLLNNRTIAKRVTSKIYPTANNDIKLHCGGTFADKEYIKLLELTCELHTEYIRKMQEIQEQTTPDPDPVMDVIHNKDKIIRELENKVVDIQKPTLEYCYQEVLKDILKIKSEH